MYVHPNSLLATAYIYFPDGKYSAGPVTVTLAELIGTSSSNWIINGFWDTLVLDQLTQEV
jgi:hypothetical protein